MQISEHKQCPNDNWAHVEFRAQQGRQTKLLSQAHLKQRERRCVVEKALPLQQHSQDLRATTWNEETGCWVYVEVTGISFQAALCDEALSLQQPAKVSEPPLKETGFGVKVVEVDEN